MARYSEKYKLMYEIMHETESPEDKFISISGIRRSDLDSYGPKLIIPSEIDGLPVRRIAPSAFAKNPCITEVEIMEGTTLIGNSAFETMDKLEKITLPKTLKAIGPDAFYNCLRLTQVSVKEGLEKIYGFAFTKCPITEFYFPESLVFIGNNAFTLTKLENIKFGDNLTSVGRRAFSTCENLESVTFGKGLKNISPFAFSNCSELRHITIPDSVGYVDEQFIEGCRSLETIHIGANTILSSDSMGFAFGCKSLKEITVSPENKRYKIIKGILYDTNNKSLVIAPAKLDIRNVNVPKWVKTVYSFCFVDNENIRTIRFNSDEINGIEELCCPDKSKVKIICSPDSKIYKFAEINGFQTGPMVSELDSFLSSCVNDEKDAKKI